MDKYYEQEAKILDFIRKLKDPHLIKPLAAYERAGLRGFLFPWAEGGNLREFWKQETKRPWKDPTLLKWVLSQMCGLCGSISTLHGVGDAGCRHGDLKPENILLFHEGGDRGMLRVADVGLAKLHEFPTQIRKGQTNTMTGTVRYEPPEFNRDPQYSRVYDVWALGCVFLEFLIWTLYGYRQLEEFGAATVVQFWEHSTERGYQVHREVRRWIERMSLDVKSKDPTSQTAIKDFLELVGSEMLVAEVDGRTKSVDLHKRFKAIETRAMTEDKYLSDPGLWDRISTQASPARNPQTGPSLEVPGATQSPVAPLPGNNSFPTDHTDTGSVRVTVHDTENSQETTSSLPAPTVQEVSLTC